MEFKEMKLAVIVCMAFPVVYIYVKLDWSPFIPIAVAGIGMYIFWTNFIDKADLPRPKIPRVGPQESFMPENETWDVGPDGKPVLRHQMPGGRNDYR